MLGLSVLFKVLAYTGFSASRSTKAVFEVFEESFEVSILLQRSEFRIRRCAAGRAADSTAFHKELASLCACAPVEMVTSDPICSSHSGTAQSLWRHLS